MAVANLTMMAGVGERHAERATSTVAACRARGCSAPGSVQCAYVDSRGRACASRWCPHHVTAVGASSYCRRHAGTVTALGGRAGDPRALPPVDHRGASLVSWVCTEGRSPLHEAVASGLRPGEVVFEDRAVNMVRRADGQRRWERGWRIGDRGGLTGKVLVCVDESDDSLVSLAVDDTVAAVATPPWISRRRERQSVAPSVDASDRAQFYGFLVRHIRRALAARG